MIEVVFDGGDNKQLMVTWEFMDNNYNSLSGTCFLIHMVDF